MEMLGLLCTPGNIMYFWKHFIVVYWVAGWLYKGVQYLILANHFTLLCITEDIFVFC